MTGDCYVSTNELFRYIERHGFTEDNFRELRFAVNQLMTENEDANERYARIVRQILREFMEEVDANLRQVDSEVRCLEGMCEVTCFTDGIFPLLLLDFCCSAGDNEWHTDVAPTCSGAALLEVCRPLQKVIVSFDDFAL